MSNTFQDFDGKTQFGTTRRSAVASTAPVSAGTPERTGAAIGLGIDPVAAEGVDDFFDGCNCSPYETCVECRGEVIPSLEALGDDDAFMDSFYRTLGGRGGCE